MGGAAAVFLHRASAADWVGGSGLDCKLDVRVVAGHKPAVSCIGPTAYRKLTLQPYP